MKNFTAMPGIRSINNATIAKDAALVDMTGKSAHFSDKTTVGRLNSSSISIKANDDKTKPAPSLWQTNTLELDTTTSQ